MIARIALLVMLASSVAAHGPDYDRSEWGRWIDADGDCQDARQEVLIAESKVSVTFKTSRECIVVAGRWNDPYTGKVFTDPSKLDIDHMVPLRNAHDSGGWSWSAERKKAYANDLDHPEHLIAVSASANRSKGARGPDEWEPVEEHWCEYARDWEAIKRRWDLSMTEAERAAINEMKEACL